MERSHYEIVAAVELSHWWFVARRRIMRAVLARALPPGRGALVVDVGCGTGANAAALAGDYRCIGIDTSEDAIRFARQRFPGVRFICGRAPDDLGGAAAEADAFLLMDVLEHVADDAGLLHPILDVMKPGGFALITVPAGMHLWSPHDESLGHYRRYDAAGLRRLWVGRPVAEVMLSYFNARLYPLVRAVRLVARLTGRSWGRAGSDMRVARRAGPGGRLLQRIFAGEAGRLAALAGGAPGRGYRRGVSLMALLRREHPPMSRRT